MKVPSLLKTIAIIGLFYIGLSISITVNANTLQNAKPIHGLVLDVNGEPLIGLTVAVKGSTNATVTDLDGRYSIRALSRDILVFTYVGFLTQEIEIKDQTTINVVMREASVALDDIVVVGYGTQKKESVTGALSSVKAKELEKISTPMLTNAIGGVVPGIITRQTSGEPGYNHADIFIRGVATMGTASKAPLILVDGIERDINLINSAEVETFTVLKDASATAVYGVRGANGVVLIETKKGKKGKPKITLRTEFANLHGLRFPDYINGYEFASLMNEASRNSKRPEPWTEEDLELFRNGQDPYLHPNVNWTDEVLRKDAFQTINNLSVSGGNETVRYFINVGYSSQTGLFKEDPQYKYRTNTKSDRYNFRSNIDISLSKDLVIDLGIGGIIRDLTFPGSSADHIFHSMKQISPINYPRQNPDGTPAGGVSYLMDNPWALTTQSGYTKQFRNTLQSTFGIKWDLSSLVTKGLNLTGKFAFDYNYSNDAIRNKKYEIKQYYKDKDGNDQYNVIRNEEAMGYQINQWSNRTFYYEASVNYNRAFNIHNVGAMILFNRNDYKDLTAGNSLLNLSYRRQSLAGRATYEFDNRYLLEFNFGYNGSENFPEGQRYGFFPSGSVGWVLTSESFWKFKPINHLKIRGSYGVVGNDQIGGRFLYLSTVNKNANGYYFGEDMTWKVGYAEDKMGTTDVTWEKSYKTDVGVDMQLFNGFINLQFDYFYEKRRDILLQRGRVPNISGITQNSKPWANIGAADNKGFDFNITASKQTSYGLYYSLGVNMTLAKNKILEDDTAIHKWENRNSRGRPIDQPFGWVVLGLFEDQEDIDNSPKQNLGPAPQPGDIKYKDVNGDNVIDDNDIAPIGYTRTPEIMFGFGGTIGYKGFELSLQFTGATRTSTFLDTEGMYPFMLEYPNYNVMREYYDNRWIPGTEDNSRAIYPAVVAGNNSNNYRTNTLYQKNAEYIKLKNAEIAYNIPPKLLRSTPLETIRVFINGNNLLCFDHIKVIDPESNYGTGRYPLQRTINFGAQLTF